MTLECDDADALAPLRVGVLGARGQLGRCLVRSIESAPDLRLAFGATRDNVDLGNFDAIAPWLDGLGEDLPDAIVNAAAYTKVDACESETELAHRINALAPAEWAREVAARGIDFVHVSTDYVFPGDGREPYTEEDETDPKTVYGTSKRAGEVGVLGADPTALIVRTSWVFGPGRNFVVAILDQAAKRRRGELDGPLTVVSDQSGAPTFAADLADALLALCRLRRRTREAEGYAVRGLLHLCNAGETTWFGFARAILDQAGYSDIEIDAVSTSSFKTAARRPAYSLMNCERAAGLGIVMREWDQALAGYLSSPDAPAELFSKAVLTEPLSGGTSKMSGDSPRHEDQK